MFKLCVLLLCLGAATGVPAARQFKFLEPKKINKSTIYTIRLGFSINIDCETTDASAVVTLWKSKKGRDVQVQPSLNIIQNGQIFTMHNINLEDAGTYTCKAQDSLNTKITKDVIVLINTYKPGLVLRPSLRKPLVTMTGSTVTFTCEAVAGTIVWRHIPDTIQTNPKPSKYTVKNIVKASITLSVLTLPNAQVSNSGTYECWLYHYDAALFRNVYLLVKDSKRPTFANGNSQPEIKIVKDGHSKHLNCEANGFPTPVLSWEKDGNPISLCKRMFVNNCQNSAYLYQRNGMKIESARFPEDNGTYTCVARNSAGVSRKHFQVVVGVKPVLDKSKSLLMKGSTVTCRAIAGNPPPKFSWSMQLYWYPSTTSPDETKWSPISKYGNTATVSSDKMKSIVRVPSMIARAFYRCVAVNKFGRDSHTFKRMKGSNRL